MRRKARWRSLLALWPTALLAAAAAARADDTPSRLDQLMAGYVLNFSSNLLQLAASVEGGEAR